MYGYYLSNKNFLSDAFYDRKYATLKKYAANVGQLEQKSSEWVNIRKTTIGGSEISTVLGLNPYSKLRQLVAQKIGLSEFRGNIATRWGCLFEEMTRKWSQLACGCKNDIIELGGIEGIHARQRYSPDGLGVVSLKCESSIRIPQRKELNNNNASENNIEASLARITAENSTEVAIYRNIITREYFIALFEYKSPMSTLPNGKIPKHYYPQIQTGLLNVKISEIGIFVNNTYRICAYADLRKDATYYNKSIHSAKEKYDASSPVYAHSIILFFVKKGEYVPIYDIIDYGTRDRDMLGKILYYYDRKSIIAYYAPISHISSEEVPYSRNQGVRFNEFYINYNDIIETAKKNENRFIGYLPWKLLKSDILLVNPDKHWQEIIETPINNTLAIIDRILSAENKEDAYRGEFDELVQVDKILEEISNPILQDDWSGILNS
jgi:hypothetical protein